MLLSLFLTSSIPITVSDSPYTSLTTRPPAWNTGGEVYMYVWCINSRIDWVAKYLLKTSWNSNTWYAFQESIFDIFPKRNKYYLHLQFTNNLLLHYILAIRVHIWSACMRSFSRSTVRCALRFGLIFFFVCWVSWCFCNIKSICSMNRNSVLLLVSFNSTWQWMKASDQRLKWDPKGGEWVRER